MKRQEENDKYTFLKPPVKPTPKKHDRRYGFRTFLWVFIILSIISLWLSPIILKLFGLVSDVFFVYHLFIVLSLIYLFLYIGIFEGIITETLSLGLGLISLIFINVAVILIFSAIYSLEGISCNKIVTKKFSDCLYFSAVTFTSLGYGDCYPEEVVRLFAAMEAFIGLLFMGGVTGVVFKALDITFSKKKLPYSG